MTGPLLILNRTVYVCVYVYACTCVRVLTLAKKEKKKVRSSISRSTHPIDSPAEESGGIRFILYNAPRNFTAQPEPNQFPAWAKNSNDVATFTLRLSPHPRPHASVNIGDN